MKKFMFVMCLVVGVGFVCADKLLAQDEIPSDYVKSFPSGYTYEPPVIAGEEPLIIVGGELGTKTKTTMPLNVVEAKELEKALTTKCNFVDQSGFLIDLAQAWLLEDGDLSYTQVVKAMSRDSYKIPWCFKKTDDGTIKGVLESSPCYYGETAGELIKFSSTDEYRLFVCQTNKPENIIKNTHHLKIDTTSRSVEFEFRNICYQAEGLVVTEKNKYEIFNVFGLSEGQLLAANTENKDDSLNFYVYDLQQNATESFSGVKNTLFILMKREYLTDETKFYFPLFVCYSK